jgi:pimeloyl-ACP methyl ester carboxylesterase
MAREPMRDIIVLLPGIMGSVLRKDGKVVWGLDGGTLAKTLLSGGGKLRDALRIDTDDPGADDLGDGITATELMPDVHLLPGVWKIDGYSKVANAIQKHFDVAEGENFFRFPYDWRRDNRVSARRLQQASAGWLARRRQKFPDAKLILVGHSMGGLVSRYFLEVLDGWKDTSALITFGTPHRGSVNAIDAIANGVRKKKLGITFVDLTDMARNLTSLYQLLPIYPCYDAGDGVMRRVGEMADIPNVDFARAQDALAFHNEIRRAVDRHLGEDDYRGGRYRTYPIVGIAQETNQSARLDGAGVKILRELNGKDLSGDGTVPRVSATPIEYSDAGKEMFAATKHGSLQNADAVLDQFKGVVTGLSIRLGEFLDVPTRHIALEVEDLLLHDEPLVVLAAAHGAADVPLAASLLDGTTNAEIRSVPLGPAHGDWQAAEIAPLTPGSYRVRVTGPGLDPVEDAFVVAPPAG